MKTTITTAVIFLAVAARSSVVFDVSTEPGGQGIRMSWVTNRWVCHDITEEGLNKNISWAFVDVGLANGCTLYE